MSSIDTPAGPSTKSEPQPAQERATAWAELGRIRLGWIVVAVVLAGLVLRLWELGERPFHHDESLDAWWSWLFRNGQYNEYDPVYHGPLRFYITAGFYEIFGESEAVARLFSALSGAAVIGLPWFMRRELGRAGTIAATVALCISPTMLYYSRFGREDAQMVFLTLLAMVLGLSYLRRPRTITATALAFVLACSFAIKESTYLFGLLLAVYLLILLAAQFDAQHRVTTGLTDDESPNPVFMTAALVYASAGLLVAVLVGSAADELFLMLGLYAASLAGLVLATALPLIRTAGVEWSTVASARAIGSVLVLAALGAMARRSDGGDEAFTVSVPWLVLGALIALLGAAILLAPGFELWASAPGLAQFARPIGAGIALVGVAMLVNEYAEGQSFRAFAFLFVALAVASCIVLVYSLPNTTTAGFTWPPLLRSIGAIGWLGWIIALATFAVAWFFYFTIWGRAKGDWASGFTRAIGYWDSQQEVNRGGQPWYYYLYALPAYEWLFVGLGFVGGWRALRRPTMLSVLFVWFAVGSLILYSYAGERMPWLIAHPLLPVLVLAALGVQQLWEHRDHAVIPAIGAVLALGLLLTTTTSIRASFTNGTDSREILSQAGQATPHVSAALQRLENIDRISIEQTGEPATLAIGAANAWPYSWYLRDRGDYLVWFNNDAGPPTDRDFEVIIADHSALAPEAYPGYQASLFALRSWWVPTYNDAGVGGWVSWVRNRSLWAQGPNTGFAGVREVEEGDVDPSLLASLGRVEDGLNSRSQQWVDFAGAAGERVTADEPPSFIEADDGRDGCGSVDQWFLVRADIADIESQVYPAPIEAMGPIECASDLLADS